MICIYIYFLKEIKFENELKIENLLKKWELKVINFFSDNW